MVVAAGRIDVFPDGFGRAEIEGCPGYRADFAGRNQLVIHRKVVLRVQLKDMAEDALGGVSRQIEKTVVAEVAQGRSVGRGPVFYLESVPLRQGVAEADPKIARPAFTAVGIDERKADAVPGDLFYVPKDPVDAGKAAVEGVSMVIGGDGEMFPVQGKGGPGETVGKPAYRRAEKALSGEIEILLKGGIAHDDIGFLSLPVRDQEGENAGAVVGYGHFQMAALEME